MNEIKLIISGYNGFMGKIVADIAGSDPSLTVVAGFDIYSETQGDCPVFADPAEFSGEADVLVDFSSPSALSGLIDFCLKFKIPPVFCTTGYSAEQIGQIESAAEFIPVFRSGNMSLGINLLTDLIKRACAVLGGDYDIEIIERHHRRKVDAPSGTALMLADAAASAFDFDSEYTFERQSRSKPRPANEIGISSVRGGTIVGEHEVVFAGRDEVIELRHTAASREVFAVGAVRAAKFMAKIGAPGLYDMNDVFSLTING